MTFQLWNCIEDLRVNRPIVKIGYRAFEKRCHPGVTSFNIPIVARIVRVGPSYTYEAYQNAYRILSGMLIKKLSNLWPGQCQKLVQLT